MDYTKLRHAAESEERAQTLKKELVGKGMGNSVTDKDIFL